MLMMLMLAGSFHCYAIHDVNICREFKVILLLKIIARMTEWQFSLTRQSAFADNA